MEINVFPGKENIIGNSYKLNFKRIKCISLRINSKRKSLSIYLISIFLSL